MQKYRKFNFTTAILFTIFISGLYAGRRKKPIVETSCLYSIQIWDIRHWAAKLNAAFCNVRLENYFHNRIFRGQSWRRDTRVWLKTQLGIGSTRANQIFKLFISAICWWFKKHRVLSLNKQCLQNSEENRDSVPNFPVLTLSSLCLCCERDTAWS